MTFLNTTRSNTLKIFPKRIILPLRGWEFQNTEKLYMPSSADDMLPARSYSLWIFKCSEL